MKYIRILTFLVVAALSVTALPAIGATLPTGMSAVPLATITNDRDTSVSKINLIVGKQAIIHGIYLTTDSGNEDKASPTQSHIYSLSGLASANGVVLGQGQGVNAIYLRGNIQPGNGNGKLVVSYLSNGIFHSYDQCQINLRQVAPQDWQLINSYNNQPISHIEVQTWALGISTLKNVCPTA